MNENTLSESFKAQGENVLEKVGLSELPARFAVYQPGYSLRGSLSSIRVTTSSISSSIHS